MRLSSLVALALTLVACAIELPSSGPGACGGVGQRCCAAVEDAGAASNGCRASLVCVPAAGLDAAVTLGGRVCVACPARQVACGNRCVDVSADGSNCGACGVVCGAGTRCVALASPDGGAPAVDGGATAVCRPVCPAGQTYCDGAGCVDLSRDASNCSACGVACPAGQSCAGGRCACALAGQTFCAGAGCVNTMTDSGHCGSCATACVPGQSCAAGACACPSGQALCAGVCVDTARDDANCGACGVSCDGAIPGAFARCVAGACQQTACVSGRGDCGAEAGCETDLLTTLNHCGACGRRCALANATSRCAAGACQLVACASGSGDCDGNATNGCETDLRTDASSCGRCANVCTAPAGRTATCAAGLCAVGTLCASGLADCDGVATNGCEAAVATDARNCGMCGRACSRVNGTPTCAGGACVSIACNAGFGNCDSNPANGCEVTFAADASHCGACGRPCVFANATATCASGACAIGACNAGFGNCDGSPANGCETSLTATNTSCGVCGRACSGGQSCAMGTCACPSGQTLCGGTCVNLMSDNTSCGACGRVCTGGQVCAAGACACSSSTMLCMGACVNVRNDNLNCGACGRACASGTRCSAGACVVSCPTGTTDCSSVGAGCVDTTTSESHCGGCGVLCSTLHATSLCVAGACQLTCEAGFGDCDGSVTSGCETSFSTTAAHCGACRASCVSAPGTMNACNAGRCTCFPGSYDCDSSRTNGCESPFPC